MQLKLSSATESSLARVAQLTQKTNQFNLTSKRYCEDEIKEFIHSEKYDVVVLEVSDRFGHMGEVGVLIIFYNDNTAHIDTFLLSCRVLGRTIEKTFLRKAIQVCNSKGVSVLCASYLPTPKNIQVKNFYAELGFKVESESDTETKYELILNNACKNDDETYFFVENLWFSNTK